VVENKQPKTLNGITGILGIGAIILSIVLFTNENAGYIFKSVVTALFQLDIGLMLVIYGIRENKMKGKPKGNSYLYVGIAALASTLYTLFVFYARLT